MKVVHIESGLGNQMLSYCELLALKKVRPDDDYYIETLVYDIPAAGQAYSQWNGFELKDIFKIQDKNICEYFSTEQWRRIEKYVEQSHFWENCWNWPRYFVEAFKQEGLQLRSLMVDFEELDKKSQKSLKSKLRANKGYQLLQKTYLFENMRRIHNEQKGATKNQEKELLFYQGADDVLTGQRLAFEYVGNDIEFIEEEIRNTFVFPELDRRNAEIAKKMKEQESVAIHVRRGDMLHLSARYYKSGYFRRATKYIKKQIENPVFYFFCDPGSEAWCRKHESTFGLNFKKDAVFFINWNLGKESYRDMQLMSLCKHNIITNSSFGWRGAFLNQNTNKITISPEIDITTTHHM